MPSKISTNTLNFFQNFPPKGDGRLIWFVTHPSLPSKNGPNFRAKQGSKISTITLNFFQNSPQKGGGRLIWFVTRSIVHTKNSPNFQTKQGSKISTNTLNPPINPPRTAGQPPDMVQSAPQNQGSNLPPPHRGRGRHFSQPSGIGQV
jgi:hypothetical protein